MNEEKKRKEKEKEDNKYKRIGDISKMVLSDYAW